MRCFFCPVGATGEGPPTERASDDDAQVSESLAGAACKVQGMPPEQRGLRGFGELPALTDEQVESFRADFRAVTFEKLEGTTESPLLQMVETGSIALVRGQYLIRLAREGRPIPRRQDAPQEAFWSREEAAALIRRSAGEMDREGPVDGAGLFFLGLFLIAFSYCWINSSHPDPECYHLRRAARILERMAKLREGWDTHQDVGVFWDFLSLHQHCAHSGAQRSELENRHFRLALSGMQYIYAHQSTCVIKLKKMPPCPNTLGADRRFEVVINNEPRRLAWHYEDRGWPTFESAVADLCRQVHWSRLEFVEEDLELDGSTEHKEVNSPLFLDFRYRHSANDPPIHPDRLASLLSARTFANGSDHEVVLDLYRRTFATMCQSKELIFVTFWWTREVCDSFAEALRAYDQLEVFELSDGSIGHAKPTGSELSALARASRADPDALRALVAPLASRTRLNRAHYCGSQASAQCLRIFCSAMPPSLSYLNLANHPVPDAECAEVLAEVLPTTTPQLKTLDFRGIGLTPMWFGDEARGKLARALPNVSILYPQSLRARPAPQDDPGGLSGAWFTVGRSDGVPNGDRYEFVREGDRYYIIYSQGWEAGNSTEAIREYDYFIFDGATARHADGTAATLLPSGDLHWDIEGGKWLSRRAVET